MPKKPPKKKSREYLESALDECRRLLPGWMFAVIHQAAFPSSGGRAARNRRLSATEKAWIEKKSVSEMSTPELKSMLHKLNVTRAAYKRQGKNTDAVIARAKSVTTELAKRGVKGKGGAADDARKKKTEKVFLPEGTKIEKGFHNGEPEGGMHAHGLDRRNQKTLVDGAHVHLFVMPGSGEVFVTTEDGEHAHEIGTDGNTTSKDGAHSHKVMGFGGGVMETKLGGAHSHELMVETTGFGALHKHELILEDGTKLTSLSPGEFAARFVDLKFALVRPICSSREVVDALNEARRLREQLFPPEDCFPSVGDAVAMLAKGEEVPAPPPVFWEVQKLANGGAYCALDDMETPLLMLNPNELHLAPGDIVEVTTEGEIEKHSESSEPHAFAEAETLSAYADELHEATKSVGFNGPQDAKLVFVSASPSPLELARKEALAGPDGKLFIERYLAPMGLTKSDVATGFAIPVACADPGAAEVELWRAHLAKSLALYSEAKIVALGRVAKQALGDKMSFSLPHPAAVRRHGDRGEVDRKVKTICKALDIGRSSAETLNSSKVDPSHGEAGTNLADSISELEQGGGLRVAVTKSLEEKQIVYGVILDPYQVDLHNDWLPPAEIETTAHDFLEKSRVIGLKHNGVAEAQIVESWVEVYPSTKDRELALQNLPHKAFERPFGSDTIHSGAWVAGVKLSDELWALHKKGDLDAFSIGGFSFKTKISTSAMPKVEFITLEPSP